MSVSLDSFDVLPPSVLSWISECRFDGSFAGPESSLGSDSATFNVVMSAPFAFAGGWTRAEAVSCTPSRTPVDPAEDLGDRHSQVGGKGTESREGHCPNGVLETMDSAVDDADDSRGKRRGIGEHGLDRILDADWQCLDVREHTIEGRLDGRNHVAEVSVRESRPPPPRVALQGPSSPPTSS